MKLVYGRDGMVGGGECLCCKGKIEPLINFGLMPLANTYNVPERYPLLVNRCTHCFHLQLHEFVDPKVLYSDYAYRSNTGRTARDFFRDFASMSIKYYPEAKNVLDIACNDGSQLDAFHDLGLSTCGIDPGVKRRDISPNHDFIPAFFEDTLLEHDFDIIVAQNVIAHTPTPLNFLENCKRIMHDKSRLFIQTSQANMIINGECDTIYHEHISYFSAWSFRHLAARAGLYVLDVILHPIHGMSFIFVLGKKGDVTRNLFERTEWERIVGMRHVDLYNWWKAHVYYKLRIIKETIEEYTDKGFYCVGLGAAAKGISLLNMSGIELDVIFDTTESKWGKMASNMKILPFSGIPGMEKEKVLFVILAWNLEHEIKQNVLKLRDNPNDVFITIK